MFDLSIHEYAEYGDIDRVIRYTSRGGDVNRRDFYRNTALHRAACMGYPEIVSYLIENGADVNAQAKDGWTPLHLAARWKRISIIRMLIEAGADCTIETNDNRIPADMIEIKSSSEEAKHIIELLNYRPPAKTIPKLDFDTTVINFCGLK
eukprot:CAMPEP_0171464440 /NCGR_PEP_ID=MMETSP0945-20130129/7762_1 /TAXON_ID=109269 /ORGANISM="Vaucheria litorea, Strain CCMP2940" /LENGTH=149 /DNA_ID=CAMNT_0011991537 /DNA_START=62 /DNA_END=511 /DNA_ORIENTATION=+